MQKILQRFSSTLVMITLVIALLPLAASHTHAQTAGSTQTTLVPPSFELFANPGDTLQEKLSIRNESGSETIYSVSTQNFEAQGDTGEVQLVSGDTSNTFALASWIHPDDTNLTIPAHSEKTLTFSISVPDGAEPGGHYGALLIQSNPGNTPGSANVSSGQVSLVLLRVSGNITEKATMVSFTAPGYSEYGPIPFDLKVKNNGDVHIKPKGTIIITDMFGAKVAEIPLDGRNVLPGSERIMTTDWTNKNPIGRFTATLVATYGEKNQAMLASTQFVVFPKPLAIGIAIAIASLVVLFILAVMGRKRISKALKVIAQG